MIVNKTIIISPSGHFYGSEQVLFDFLAQTQNLYKVYVPRRGRLIEKLISQKKHTTRSFGSIKFLYLKIFFQLLLGKANVIYTNEGGHIRYFKVLARAFKKRKFVVHIRIIEDTDSNRIGLLTKNVVLLSISDYVTALIGTSKQFVRTFYDPYISKSNIRVIRKCGKSRIKVGIVGRVTDTKGLEDIECFCDFLEKGNISNIHINLFGDVEKEKQNVLLFIKKSKNYSHVEITFHGFVENKDELYNSIDIVIHFSKVEPLGRIFFESLDYGIPFIGFNAGGIGEIARILHLEDCMINQRINWEADLCHKINTVQKSLQKYQAAKENCEMFFSADAYCKALEKIILV